MLKKKRSQQNVLDDGSPASTGHKPKKKLTKPAPPVTEPIIQVPDRLTTQIETDRKVEAYSYQIRNEIRKLSALTEEISKAYSLYAESNERIDSSQTVHNGLANMMKLIEVQTTTKLRIKKMQTAIMQAIAATTNDDELPYAVQDIMREVNINFLDSKLVRAYGELARIMKEDLELAKHANNEIQFTPDGLASELESMPTIEVEPGSDHINDDIGEFEDEETE